MYTDCGTLTHLLCGTSLAYTRQPVINDFIVFIWLNPDEQIGHLGST